MNQIHFFSSMCAPCECWAVLCFLGSSVPDLSISSAGAVGMCSGVNLSIRKPLLRTGATWIVTAGQWQEMKLFCAPPLRVLEVQYLSDPREGKEGVAL